MPTSARNCGDFFLKTMIRLNNELATLSRENVRKGRELARALADLERTQAMLVHREKMASLGQLTAVTRLWTSSGNGPNLSCTSASP